MLPLGTSAGSLFGTIGGAALGGVFRVVAAVRPTAKPLHPRGTVRRGRLHRHGAEPPTGVAFLDVAATDEVLVRESRATGLPRPLPDVQGLALRVPGPGGPVTFDAVLNTPPGLAQYDVVRRLREPAYAAARAGRDGP